ncbi:hypothetical protein ACN9MJ_12855 [Acidovorax facilis]|uniref:hypothetical protein n=1 Tax=Acidovorax facilis TaxID=12917 RepID=UPI003CEE18CA
MPEWVLQLLGYAGGAIAVYAGIRADLARLGAEVKNAAVAANKAHDRIDQLIARG